MVTFASVPDHEEASSLPGLPFGWQLRAVPAPEDEDSESSPESARVSPSARPAGQSDTMFFDSVQGIVRSAPNWRREMAQALVRAEQAEARLRDSEVEVGRAMTLLNGMADEALLEARREAADIIAAAKAQATELLQATRSLVQQSFDVAAQSHRAAPQAAAEAEAHGEEPTAVGQPEDADGRLAELIRTVAGYAPDAAPVDASAVRAVAPHHDVAPLHAVAPLHLVTEPEPTTTRWHKPNDMDWFGRSSDTGDFAKDDYFADLRDALDDPQPLGPRDEPEAQPEPVAYESFVLLSPATEPALPEAEAPVGAEPAAQPVRRRAHAKTSARRRQIVRASHWIRNASALALAIEVLAVARHL